MKSAIITIAGLLGAALANPLVKRAGVQGFDISHYQSTVDFKGAYGAGSRFVIIKATEGTDYIDSSFSSHWSGASSAGLVRGAYHFAHPDSGSGAAQANYFLQHGGKWTNDGKTLPGMLDIEYNPSGSTCYGLSTSAMTSWVQDFVNTYHSATGRYPMIYSTANWWEQCTGNAKNFANECPLVLARYGSSPGTMPGGWASQTIWQNSDKYTYGGDSDVFNGSDQALTQLAAGSGSAPTSTPTPKPKAPKNPSNGNIQHRADHEHEVRWA
jgi:GH25 family lysozyme M1 (1,4-beta-N-acetylmuramidase)